MGSASGTEGLNPLALGEVFLGETMEDENIPAYCLGEVWPYHMDTDRDDEQETPLAFDADAKPFHIGQSYEESKAQPLKCLKCGGKEFHVGQGSYYTAIRCVRCEWECCIHKG
jgi:hypothetical protein